MEKGFPVPASAAHTATEIPPGLFSPVFVSNPQSAAFGNTSTSLQTSHGSLLAFFPIPEVTIPDQSSLAKKISH